MMTSEHALHELRHAFKTCRCHHGANEEPQNSTSLTMAATALSCDDTTAMMSQSTAVLAPHRELSTNSLDSDLWSEETSKSDPLDEQSEFHSHGVTAPENSDTTTCDACPFCDDTCGNPSCIPCKSKSEIACAEPESLFPFLPHGISPCSENKHGGERQLTMCQVRRHNTLDSAWLLVANTVYDATKFLARHPGGAECLLKKSGGAADCTADMKFHSRKAVRMMKDEKVGKLVKCQREVILSETQDGCAIM